MLKKLSFITLTSLALACQAANVTTIARYASVTNKPLAAQVNPLQAVQQIYFPQQIQTIGEAIEHWLKYSGFHLAPESKQQKSLKIILKQPLPQVDRSLGPVSVANGLSVLVGPHLFELKHDDLLREVNFTLIKRRET
ncbi:PFGI-1 class ICE element type IV pilus protein PilL2 [Legionella spiritensis]|uniref:PFGI-1 class ICE element type IV pilus protein PilL2 n=1 Tax=Legionella spiritensis TaxID=452 RepID=UPI000F6D9BE1|nr:hypothetical protein [Legionella spiritensis]VEG92566.1 integrating conjugative element protein PilL, PFGI-1 class [Legionella spiritensis]